MGKDGDKVVSKGYKYFMVFLCMLTQAIPYGIAQLIQPLFVHRSEERRVGKECGS